MRTLHIIMPMAGEGSRFREVGYNVPKPLIKFEGKELYRHALDSLNFSDLEIKNEYKQEIPIKYTFIVRKEFITDYNIEEEIHKYYPEANILSVEKTTRGALETVMLASNLIDNNDYVISMDCDIKFDCNTYCEKIYYKCVTNATDPMVLSFNSSNPIYSYIKPHNEKYGYFIAEKNVISTFALGGCYCLGNGKRFKTVAEEYIKDYNNGNIKAKELYLSLVFNYIVNKYNTYVRIINMDPNKDHYWSLGTPYDLEHYNYNRNIWDK